MWRMGFTMSTIRRMFTTLKMGIVGAWKHRSMGLASIISIIATLIILGVVLIITITANSLAKDIQGKVDEVEIFIKSDASQTDVDRLKSTIEKTSKAKTLEYRSSEDALKIMKKSWGENADILDGVTVLPASYFVRLNNIEDAETFVKEIKMDKAVDDVRYFQDVVNKVSKISRFIQTGGVGLTILLVIISIFIISNTVKLTVFARSKEISVMKYIGATNHMIRAPFMIEGLIFGFIGSIASFFIVIKAYEFIFKRYSGSLYNVLSSYLINPQIIKNDMMIIFLSLGIGIGIIGSVFSMRKHLKV